MNFSWATMTTIIWWISNLAVYSTDQDWNQQYHGIFLFWYLLAPHLAICSNDLQIKITHLKVFVDRYSSSKRLSCSTRISVAQNGVNSNIYLLLLRTSLKHLHIGALLCCEIATHYFLETVPVVLFELY